jgi:hypothetical protein
MPSHARVDARVAVPLRRALRRLVATTALAFGAVTVIAFDASAQPPQPDEAIVRTVSVTADDAVAPALGHERFLAEAWSIDTGNGYDGGLQFDLDSWRWVGGSGYPHEASQAEQIDRAEILHQREGWNAWPACSRELGLR